MAVVSNGAMTAKVNPPGTPFAEVCSSFPRVLRTLKLIFGLQTILSTYSFVFCAGHGGRKFFAPCTLIRLKPPRLKSPFTTPPPFNTPLADQPSSELIGSLEEECRFFFWLKSPPRSFLPHFFLRLALIKKTFFFGINVPKSRKFGGRCGYFVPHRRGQAESAWEILSVISLQK